MSVVLFSSVAVSSGHKRRDRVLRGPRHVIRRVIRRVTVCLRKLGATTSIPLDIRLPHRTVPRANRKRLRMCHKYLPWSTVCYK
jgi:hypothetical protein